MKNLILFVVIFTTFCSCSNDANPVPDKPKIVNKWKLVRFIAETPFLGSNLDLTNSLNPCALKVTYFFREDFITTLEDIPKECQNDVKDLDLVKDGISKWKISGDKLTIFEETTKQEDEYHLKIEADTMTWSHEITIPLPIEYGGNQTVNQIITFVKK